MIRQRTHPPPGLRTALQALLVLILCLPPACGAGARLTLFPERVELKRGEHQHGLRATLTDAAGAPSDVTSDCTYTSRSPEVATVDTQGMVHAKGDGATEILVTFQGQTTRIPVTIQESVVRRTPSFLQDVEPVLTKSGCNQGGCHGKLAGQNGFKLSLRGFAPDWDHDWLTRDIGARRINLAFPDESLILQKAAGRLPHEGGARFREDSPSYALLRDWLAARAPGPATNDPSPVAVTVFPSARSMRPGETQRLLVQVRYSDGRTRDVTWLAQFFSNDESTLKVTPDGLVKGLRSGEGSVRVHFQGFVEVARFTIPYPGAPGTGRDPESMGPLDAPIFSKLRALHIRPSPLCDDATFIRRAFLDTIGQLPSTGETEAFVADKRAEKRALLADALLGRAEWSEYWALKLADLLQNRRERDHDVRGTDGVRAFHAWLRTQLAEGRGWHHIASDILLSRGNVTNSPGVGYYVTLVGEYGKVEESELPDSVAQAFLGTRVGCARCHNHPLERYTQDDFYHFAAFFSKMSIQRESPDKGGSTLHLATREERDQNRRAAELEERIERTTAEAVAYGEEPGGREFRDTLKDQQRELGEALRRAREERTRPPAVTQPRTGRPLSPRGLDRAPWSYEPERDPREQLVDQMVASTQFSGAMANRIWRHFFGVGLVEPVDDLRASNPPSNSELWGVLTREFSTHGFDLRHLMREILNSRAYQLSSSTEGGNETDARFYSHYYARRLEAEVLQDAISSVTGTPARFEGHPAGMRAVQLPDAGTASYFLTLFGRSDRVTACACERAGDVTLPQLLHLHNGEDLQTQIVAPAGRLTPLLAIPDDRAVAKELFLAALGRPPSPAELAALSSSLPPAEREQGFRDLLWALINSKEFAFNH